MFDLLNAFMSFEYKIKLRFFSEFLAKISNFLIIPVITYSIGVQEYGYYVIIISVLTGLIPIFTLGLNFTIIKKLSNVNSLIQNSQKLFSCLYLIIAFTLIISFLCMVISFFLNQYFILIFLTLISASFSSIQIVLFEMLRSKYQSNNFCYFQITDSFIFLAGIFILSKFNNLNLNYILIILIFNKFFISTLILFTLAKNKIISFHNITKEKLIFKTYILPGIIFIILGISEWLINFSDKLIIGYYLDSVSLTIYFTAGLLSSIINSIGSVFWWELLPKLNEFKSKNQYPKIFNLIKQKNENFIHLSNLTIIGITIVSPIIQNLLLNLDVGEKYFLVLIYFISIFFHQISTGWEFFCYIENKGKFVLINTICWGLFSFICYLLLIPYLGLYGALTTLLITKLGSSLSLFLYSKKIGFKESIIKNNLNEYLIPFIISILLFFVIKKLSIINQNMYMDSVSYLLISILTYFLINNLIKKNRI